MVIVDDLGLRLAYEMTKLHFSCYLVNESDFSHPAPTRFPPFLFMIVWILCLTKYDGINDSYRMSKSLLKKRFPVFTRSRIE